MMIEYTERGPSVLSHPGVRVLRRDSKSLGALGIDWLTGQAFFRDKLPTVFEDDFLYDDVAELYAAGYAPNAGGEVLGSIAVDGGALTVTDAAGDAYVSKQLTAPAGVYDVYVEVISRTSTNCALRLGSSFGTTVGGGTVNLLLPTNPGVMQFAGTISTRANPWISIVNLHNSMQVTIGSWRIVRRHKNGLKIDVNALAPPTAPSPKYITNAHGFLERGITHRCDHDPSSYGRSLAPMTSFGTIENAVIRKTLPLAEAMRTYTAGEVVRATATTDISKWLLGTVVSHADGTLVFDVYATSGGYFSGSDWTVMVALGLLTENARTNNLLRTSGSIFSGGGWGGGGVTQTSDGTLAPDGVSLATRLDATAASSVHRINQAITYVDQNCASIYARPGVGSNKILLTDNTTASTFRVLFDLAAGTASILLGTPNVEIIRSRDGWLRCVVHAPMSGGLFVVYQANADGNISFNDITGVGYFYVWGPQVETTAGYALGGRATSYIPTEAAQVTRSGDEIAVNIWEVPWIGTSMNGVSEFIPRYEDRGSGNEYFAWRYYLTTTNYAQLFADASGTRTAQAQFFARGGGGVINASSTPAINVTTPPGGVIQRWGGSYDATIHRMSVNAGAFPAPEDTTIDPALPTPGLLYLSLPNNTCGHKRYDKFGTALLTMAELDLETSP